MDQNNDNDTGFNIYNATQRGSRRVGPGTNNDGPAKRTRTQTSKKNQGNAADGGLDGGNEKIYGETVGADVPGGPGRTGPVHLPFFKRNRASDQPADQVDTQYEVNSKGGSTESLSDGRGADNVEDIGARNTGRFSEDLARSFGIGLSPWAEEFDQPVKKEATRHDRDGAPDSEKVKIQESKHEPHASAFGGFALPMMENDKEIADIAMSVNHPVRRGIRASQMDDNATGASIPKMGDDEERIGMDDGSGDDSILYTEVNVAEELMNHLQIRMTSQHTRIRSSEVSGLELNESFDRFLGASRYLPVSRQEDLVATAAEFADVLASVNEDAHPTANTIIFEKFYSALVRTTSRERKAVLLEKWFAQLTHAKGDTAAEAAPDDPGMRPIERKTSPIEMVVNTQVAEEITSTEADEKRFKYIQDRVIECHIGKHQNGPTVIDRSGVVFERVAGEYLSTEYEVFPGSTYQIRLRSGHRHNNPPLDRRVFTDTVATPDVAVQQSYPNNEGVSSISRTGAGGVPSDSSDDESSASSGGGYQRGSTPYFTRSVQPKKKGSKSDDEGLDRRNRIRTEQSRSMIDGDYLQSIRKVLMSRLLRRYREYTAKERDVVKGSRAPKVEAPKVKYCGEKDFSVLEDWVLEQSTYFSAAHLSGPDAETDRMLHIKGALDGEAYRWYRVHVIGYSAGQDKIWTVESIIRELFRRFIDIGKLHDLRDAFNAFRWANTYEVDTYYSELMMIVEIMPIMPSENEIIQKFRGGLPPKVTDKMIDVLGVNMTTESLRSLRRSAVAAEDMIRQRKNARQHAERERIVAETYAEAIKKIDERDARPTAPRISRVRDAPRGSDRRFIARKEADVGRHEEIERRKEPATRDEKRISSTPRPRRVEEPGERKTRVPVCFDCGVERERMGHTGCKNPGSGKFRPKPRERMQAMYASDADDESYESEESGKSRTSTGARTIFDVESGNIVDDHGDPETSDDGEYSGEFIRAMHVLGDTCYEDKPLGGMETVDYDLELEMIAMSVALSTLGEGDWYPYMGTREEYSARVQAMTAIQDAEQQVLELSRPGRKGRKTVELDLSSRIIERLIVRPLERMCLVTYTSVVSSVKDCLALTLWDSGSTIQGVSHVFAELAKLRVYQLKDAIPLYLGTIGSRSLIKYGTFAETKFGNELIKSYLDLVNLDRYDMLIGVPFMLKNRVILDFEHRCVRIGSLIIPGEVVPVNQAVQMRAHMRQKDEIPRRHRGHTAKDKNAIDIINS